MEGCRIRDKDGGATRRRGVQLGDAIWYGDRSWTPIVWDDEEAPVFYETDGLEELEIRNAWIDGIPAPKPEYKTKKMEKIEV